MDNPLLHIIVYPVTDSSSDRLKARPLLSLLSAPLQSPVSSQAHTFTIKLTTMCVSIFLNNIFTNKYKID